MVAPQPVLSPTRAAGWPSTLEGEPEMISVMPWPGMGQLCRSPWRATGFIKPPSQDAIRLILCDKTQLEKCGLDLNSLAVTSE